MHVGLVIDEGCGMTATEVVVASVRFIAHLARTDPGVDFGWKFYNSRKEPDLAKVAKRGFHSPTEAAFRTFAVECERRFASSAATRTSPRKHKTGRDLKHTGSALKEALHDFGWADGNFAQHREQQLPKGRGKASAAGINALASSSSVLRPGSNSAFSPIGASPSDGGGLSAFDATSTTSPGAAGPAFTPTSARTPTSTTMPSFAAAAGVAGGTAPQIRPTKHALVLISATDPAVAALDPEATAAKHLKKAKKHAYSQLSTGVLTQDLKKECKQQKLGIVWIDSAKVADAAHHEHVARTVVQDRITSLLTKNFWGTIVPMHMLLYESDWLHRSTVIDVQLATAIDNGDGSGCVGGPGAAAAAAATGTGTRSGSAGSGAGNTGGTNAGTDRGGASTSPRIYRAQFCLSASKDGASAPASNNSDGGQPCCIVEMVPLNTLPSVPPPGSDGGSSDATAAAAAEAVAAEAAKCTVSFAGTDAVTGTPSKVPVKGGGSNSRRRQGKQRLATSKDSFLLTSNLASSSPTAGAHAAYAAAVAAATAAAATSPSSSRRSSASKSGNGGARAAVTVLHVRGITSASVGIRAIAVATHLAAPTYAAVGLCANQHGMPSSRHADGNADTDRALPASTHWSGWFVSVLAQLATAGQVLVLDLLDPATMLPTAAILQPAGPTVATISLLPSRELGAMQSVLRTWIGDGVAACPFATAGGSPQKGTVTSNLVFGSGPAIDSSLPPPVQLQCVCGRHIFNFSSASAERSGDCGCNVRRILPETVLSSVAIRAAATGDDDDEITLLADTYDEDLRRSRTSITDIWTKMESTTISKERSSLVENIVPTPNRSREDRDVALRRKFRQDAVFRSIGDSPGGFLELISDGRTSADDIGSSGRVSGGPANRDGRDSASGASIQRHFTKEQACKHVDTLYKKAITEGITSGHNIDMATLTCTFVADAVSRLGRASTSIGAGSSSAGDGISINSGSALGLRSETPNLVDSGRHLLITVEGMLTSMKELREGSDLPFHLLLMQASLRLHALNLSHFCGLELSEKLADSSTGGGSSSAAADGGKSGSSPMGAVDSDDTVAQAIEDVVELIQMGSIAGEENADIQNEYLEQLCTLFQAEVPEVIADVHRELEQPIPASLERYLQSDNDVSMSDAFNFESSNRRSSDPLTGTAIPLTVQQLRGSSKGDAGGTFNNTSARSLTPTQMLGLAVTPNSETGAQKQSALEKKMAAVSARQITMPFKKPAQKKHKRKRKEGRSSSSSSKGKSKSGNNKSKKARSNHIIAETPLKEQTGSASTLPAVRRSPRNSKTSVVSSKKKGQQSVLETPRSGRSSAVTLSVSTADDVAIVGGRRSSPRIRQQEANERMLKPPLFPHDENDDADDDTVPSTPREKRRGPKRTLKL